VNFDFPGFLATHEQLHVWGSWLVGMGLIVIEIVLLLFRQRTILGYLNWANTEPPQTRSPDKGSSDTPAAKAHCGD
jgi:hypothetical protein